MKEQASTEQAAAEYRTQKGQDKVLELDEWGSYHLLEPGG